MKSNNIKAITSLIIFIIFLGAFIGGSTNLINGYVSPVYFKNIMRWDFEDVWAASVAQGIFEGLRNGVVFSIIFGIAITLITKGHATLRFGLIQLSKITINIYLFWIIGGLIALGLATLSPDFYQNKFRMVPTETKEMLAYAWVGGSIWGANYGSILSILIGIINARTNWKEINPST